jgi:peptide/nickel transport system permease protein
MTRYALRRLAWLPVILFAVSVIVFVILRELPGQDPAAAIAGQGARPEDLAQIRQQLGLDKSLPEQYAEYMKNVLSGSFGHEYNSKREIFCAPWNSGDCLFWDKFEPTAQIIGLGLFFAVLFGVSFGVISAMYRNSVIDYIVRVFAVIFSSIPEFFLLTLLIVIPSYLWNYAQPSGGYVRLWDDPMHWIRLMLPASFILGISGSAGLMRLTRTTMLEVLRSDYIRTAHAKGLRQHTVILAHAMRNAGTPIVTAIGTAFIAVFGGNIIVERILSIQGLGLWFFTAALIRDIPVVQFLAVYTAFIVVLMNLIVDLSYGFIDPRVRYS